MTSRKSRSQSAPPNRAVLGLTLGDPCGIGPELVLKAFRTKEIRELCRLVAIGERSVLEFYARLLKLKVRMVPFASGAQRKVGAGELEIIEPSGSRLFTQPPVVAKIMPEAGEAAFRAIVTGVDTVHKGLLSGLVTAPIHKGALHAAGHDFPGHTELLAQLAGVPRVAMMMVGGGMCVSLATVHEPLARVPTLLNIEGLLETFRLTHEFLLRMAVEAPRIGVAGLNPHAGEGGIFGKEEQEIIAPAIAKGRSKGLNLTGPLPGDTIFHEHRQGRFDAVVAMYHDQGLVAVKTLDFHGGVNVTLGLPFVRTSPDHGTAFDIAGKGVADPRSFLAAIRLAAGLQ